MEIIGKGSYGFVAKGKCRITNRVVALKIMIDQAKQEYDCMRVIREIQIMRKLNQLSSALLKST